MLAQVVDSGGKRSGLSAGSDDSAAVVFKISEAVGASLGDLYLVMEAFVEAIVFG
jgi:hypothetical protein